MSETVKYILLTLSVLSPILPLVLGRKQYKCLLWWYIAAGLFCDVLLILLKRVFETDYHWVSHLYLSVQFVLLLLYYHKKVINTFILVLLLAECGGYYLYTELFLETNRIYNVNNIGSAAMFLVFTGLSIAGFYKILKEQRLVRIERSSFFWVNTAILFYAAPNVIVFLCINYLSEIDTGLLFSLWGTFTLAINVIKNVIFARAITLKD